MNRRRILIGVAVLAVVLVGGAFAYQQFASDEGAESSAEGADGTTAETPVPLSTGFVSAEGQIVPRRSAMLSFQTGGLIESIAAPAGTVVSAGDPILLLDATDQEIAVRQAEAAVQQAQANLATAEVGLMAAQTGVRAAEVGVEAAEAQLSLATSDPTEAQIALNEAQIALANSTISQASANQEGVLDGPLASQIQAAEAQLQSAEADMLSYRNELDVIRREDSNNEDGIAAAEAAYNAAVAAVNAAQAQVDELRGGATDGERQAAAGGVAGAVAQRDAAQAQLDLLLAGSRAEEITVAEAGVVQAEAGLAEAELAVTQAESAVTQAEAGVAQAEAGLQSAMDALALMTLKAPFDGIVANISAELGEVAAAGIPIVQFGSQDGWMVETTDLTELDVVSLNVGDTVDVRVDAIPDEVLTGVIREISQVSTLDRGDVTYTVKIELEDYPDLPLRWGMTVFVDVDVEDSGEPAKPAETNEAEEDSADE